MFEFGGDAFARRADAALELVGRRSSSRPPTPSVPGPIRTAWPPGRSGLTSEEKEELAWLHREVKQLRQEREVLLKATIFFVRETMSPLPLGYWVCGDRATVPGATEAHSPVRDDSVLRGDLRALRAVPRAYRASRIQATCAKSTACQPGASASPG